MKHLALFLLLLFLLGNQAAAETREKIIELTDGAELPIEVYPAKGARGWLPAQPRPAVHP